MKRHADEVTLDYIVDLRKKNEQLVEALKAMVKKAVRWHPLDPVLVQAREAIAAAEIERLRDKVQWLEMCENTVIKQDNEIERLREALKDINSQMRQADRYLLKESTLVALKETE